MAAWRLDGFRDWLEELLGPLTVYAVGDMPPPNPSARQDTPRPQPPEPPAEQMLAWLDDVPSWEPDVFARATAEPDEPDGNPAAALRAEGLRKKMLVEFGKVREAAE